MPPSVPLRTSPTREVVREPKRRAKDKRKHMTNSTINDSSSTQSPQATATATSDNNNNNSLVSANMLGTGLNMYGGGMYGGGMYGGGLLMGSPYGHGGGMMGTTGPLSSLNQMLFSVQSVIFSLGQAVQIVGMNTQALHQLLDTATTMLDHALTTFKEMRMLDAVASEQESEEDQVKRRRLKALRWAFIMSVVYGGYRLIRRVLRQRHRQRLLTMYPAPTSPTAPFQAMQQPSHHGYPSYNGTPQYSQSPYSSHYGYGGGASSMYPGGGYGSLYF